MTSTNFFQLDQVGPDYTQELLEAAGVSRFPWRNEEVLLKHYIGNDPAPFLVEIVVVVFFCLLTAFDKDPPRWFGGILRLNLVSSIFSWHGNRCSVCMYWRRQYWKVLKPANILMCLVDGQITQRIGCLVSSTLKPHQNSAIWSRNLYSQDMVRSFWSLWLGWRVVAEHTDSVLSKMHGCTFFCEIQSQEQIFDPGRRNISKLQDLSAYLGDKLRCINMHQHYHQDVSKWFKMYLSTRFKLWNPGVASSPMGVKLVALSFDLSRARGFGGESFSSLAAMDAKSSACFLRWSNIIMCYPKIYIYIYI